MKNPIEMFFHCKLCIEEMTPGISPAQYEEISAGIDIHKNIVIWCNRHDIEITVLKRNPDFSKN